MNAKKLELMKSSTFSYKSQLSIFSSLLALQLLLTNPNLCMAAGSASGSAAAVKAEDRKTDTHIQVKGQALTIFKEYLQLDTSNPPGNEKLGADYLAKVLKENGIEASVFETAPGRACVYARLKGTGKRKGVVLLNHIDVVPAHAPDWKFPPFSGTEQDGEIWGRGAIDMKGMGIIELMSMIAIKRSGKLLDRDLVFLGTPDEEVGGAHGAAWFVKNKGELIKDCEYLINEGFIIDAYSDGKAKYWGVDVAEKNILWLGLTAKGLAGHASMPQDNSANNRMVRALARLADNPPPFTLLPEVKHFYESIAHTEPAQLGTLYRNIEKSTSADKATASKLKEDKLKSSMLANTVSLTVMKAGYKTNVIPAESYCELDCRLLPGVDHQAFIKQIREILQDDSIEVSVIQWEKAEPSPFESAFVKAVKKVNALESKDGKTPVVPVIVPWFTDSHWFREVGLKAYGFAPVEIDAEHLATMHGKDERLPISSFNKGIDRLTLILQELAQLD